ncbi:ATP-binding cassette domain-containing protein [Lentzea sp. NBRC 105346]|uniref:ATP-binding cassette domain-containing protein n=1 Tax=Lentzea sp. NBRC 105346 TaxID=3032205 RepID=UPI00255664E5|nr:ATP-binding cassette domain-containing protein [Lentzea sp. NBRC 105346]
MELVEVGKRYGRGPWVLRDLSLSVSGLVVLTGGNGSGKSTLLRIVAGITAPTRGSVVGRPRSVGYVPERFPSDVRMSAQSYLGHMGAIRGRKADVLERLGFRGDLTAPMSALSKGNAQKVAIAQALAATDLLVLDEPFTGLDTTAATALVELLKDRTAVVADHEGHLPSEQVISLSDGHVVIELSRVSGLDELSELDGVRDVSERGIGARVLVEPAHSDRVLAEALRLGCSVRSVRS